MKTKLFLAALALPVAFGGIVALHPGVAFAAPAYARPELASSFRQAGSYTVDPMHTSIGFEIGHLGLTRIQGRFTKFSGRIQADPKSLARSGVEFTVQTESVDTAVAPRDAHLRTPDFFDAAKYPEMTFRSTRIRKVRNGYVADGLLTLKGTTKPLSIAFRQYGPITDQRGAQRIGVVAEPFTLNRQSFGVAYDQKLPDGTPTVADEVTVRLALEATLDKPAAG